MTVIDKFALVIAVMYANLSTFSRKCNISVSN